MKKSVVWNFYFYKKNNREAILSKLAYFYKVGIFYWAFLIIGLSAGYLSLASMLSSEAYAMGNIGRVEQVISQKQAPAVVKEVVQSSTSAVSVASSQTTNDASTNQQVELKQFVKSDDSQPQGNSSAITNKNSDEGIKATLTYQPQDNNESFLVLKSTTLSELEVVRKHIEDNGGKVRTVFPPSALIGQIPSSVVADLESLDVIWLITQDPVSESDLAGHSENSVRDAGLYWNNQFHREEVIQNYQQENSLNAQQTVVNEQPGECLKIPADLPKTKDEKLTREKEYRHTWEQKSRELNHAEHNKRRHRLQSEGKDEGSENYLFNMITGEQPSYNETTAANTSLVAGAPGSGALGAPVGAGFYDTSLYLAGKVAVGVFFVSGTNGAWTQADIDNYFSFVTVSLDSLTLFDSKAKAAFTYVKETGAHPAGGDCSLNPSACRTYLNNLRAANNTDWAYMITVANGTGRAYAYLNGPEARIYRASSIAGTIWHESMHIFGAMDQYHPDAARSPIDRWGYLNVVNANSQYNDGRGYFGGAGEGLNDIMVATPTTDNPVSAVLGAYTRGQIGWRDKDGNGIFDPLDTFPETQILSITGTNPLTISGHAEDKPLPTELSTASFNSVSINRIQKVEYRLNAGAWKELQQSDAVDGAFDSGSEDFNFILPSLKNGSYVLETRATNSINNVEKSYAKEVVFVSGSSVTNNPPVAAFTVNHTSGSVGTTFVFDASSSGDAEESTGSLLVRWDFENDGIWDTGYTSSKTVSHVYSTAGVYTVRLGVQDTAVSPVATDTATKQINVQASNGFPTASFTVTPESLHSSATSFPVNLDASSSSDGEDDPASLQVRWDFQNDGTWDTNWLTVKQLQYTYTVTPPKTNLWHVNMQVKDTAGHVSSTQREIWAVPYNHPPTVAAVQVTDETNRLVQCIGATDPDSGTTWDGILEYRWDFENDGVWDTEYDAGLSTATFPSDLFTHGSNTIVCEVKDRFGATAQQTYNYIPSNVPPSIQFLPTQTVYVNEVLRFSVIATDANNDNLTLSASNLPAGATFSISINQPGHIEGILNWVPTAAQQGNYTVGLQASDGKLTDNGQVNIVVTTRPATVFWTDLVGVSANGNTITKTSSNGWNADAISLQHIPGDGGVDFLAQQTNTYRMCGLSDSNPDSNYASLDYSVLLGSDALVYVYENGTSRGSYGSYIGSDRFSVIRTGSVVQYRKNGTVFYTSTVPSSGNLIVDTSLYSTGSLIADANIIGGVMPPNQPPVADNQSVTAFINNPTAITLTGSDPERVPLTFSIISGPTNGSLSGLAPNVTYTPNSNYVGSDSFTFVVNDGQVDSNIATVTIDVLNGIPPDPVIWTDLVGVSANGNTITKTAGTTWGNGGAASVQFIPADGSVEFWVQEANTYRMMGLSDVNTDANWNTIDYDIYLRADGVIEVYESGTSKGTFGSYVTGDRFRIRRTGSTIIYRKSSDGGTTYTTFYTSTVPSSGNLIVDTALYNNGATVANAYVRGGAKPPNNPPVAQNQSVTIIQNTPKNITLVATDLEGAPLTYSIMLLPAHGNLLGTPPNLTYVPQNNYLGTDSFSFQVNDGQASNNLSNTATVSISVKLPPPPPVPVQWTNLVGVSVSGNTITKTAGTGWGNGGATSFQIIPGDGGVNMRADETGTYRMVGLSDINTDANWNTIDYDIFLVNNGTVMVYESGNYMGTFGTYANGDRFSVERTGNIVEYMKSTDKGASYTTFYTSTVPSNGNLIVDTSLYTSGATVADANIVGGILPPNNPPVANNQNVLVMQNSSQNSIALTGSDPEGTSLTYTVVSNPSHGSLGGTPPSLTYTPAASYIGADSFTFKVSDGVNNSNVATVSINVQVPPDPVIWADLVGVSASGNTITKTAPTGWGNGGAASKQQIPADGRVEFCASNHTDTYRMIGLSDVNVDNNYQTLDYALYLEAGGTISVYEDGTGRGSFGSYVGTDCFMVERTGTTIEYKKNGTTFYTSTVPSSGNLIVDTTPYNNGTIITANVRGAVIPPNQTPTAQSQNVTVTQNIAKNITLVGSDPDGYPGPFSYRIVSFPTHGSLSGAEPNKIYTPNNGYLGSDQFTFVVNDGAVDSALATVTISVVAPPPPPTPIQWTSLVGVGTSANTITKTASTTWGNGGAVSSQSISGDGSMDFRANETNTYRLAGLSKVNTDANWNTIDYAVYLRADGVVEVYESGFSRGTFGSYAVGDRFKVRRTGSVVTYEKSTDNGATYTTFYTSTISSSGNLIADTSLYNTGSTVADANITGGALPVNNPPVAQSQSVNVVQNTPTNIVLVATDPEGGSLTYSIVSSPAHGSFGSTTPPNLTYTPTTGYVGSDSFTFQASDGTNNSNVATVSITVTAPPPPPQPVIWKDLVGVSASGNTITKTAGTAWGNGGAASVQYIPANGSVEFTAQETNTYRMMGLSKVNTDANYSTIDYAVYLVNNATVMVYESGVSRGTFGAYAAGNKFRVERTGSTITYKKSTDNGATYTTFYTSTVSSSGNLMVDTSLYSAGATVVANVLGSVIGTSANYVGTDTTTQGNWKGVYGADGYEIISDSVVPASYLQVTVTGTESIWATATTDVRALQRQSAGRIAASRNTTTSMTMDMNVTDGQIHKISLYNLDWDRKGRQQRIDIYDAVTNALLNTQTVTNFDNGIYLSWNLSGHVRIVVTNTGATGLNAVISGIFAK